MTKGQLKFSKHVRAISHLLHWTYGCFLAILLTYLRGTLQIFGDWQGKGQGPYIFFTQ